jgi:DNA topoisomerase-2
MNKHKTIEQTYKVLDEIDHVRARVGMYAGSPVLETTESYVFDLLAQKMHKRQLSIIPALVKVVSEAIDNSVDEHKRNPQRLNVIKFNFTEDGGFTLHDNGGIPVEFHNDVKQYVPEMIFGTLRSGSNYNDDEDQTLIGTNGLGVKLLNILSSYFKVETADGKNAFKQEFENGMRERGEPIVKPSNKNYTKITCIPDFAFFGIDGFGQDHIDKITKRLVDVAGCNPNLWIYINDVKIKIRSFDEYIKFYKDTYLFDTNGSWDVGFAESTSSGFEQTTFVNGVETYMGGSHVDYITNQIVAGIRDYFKAKKKIDVKPGDIRAHLHIFASTTVNRPKFSSQTKENMISPVGDFVQPWECSDKFIRKIISSPVIQTILDWVTAKEEAARAAEMRKLNKNTNKSDPKSVENFIDATTKNRKDAVIFLTEGLSASGGIKNARDSKTMALFPLRGKPINAYEIDTKRLLENEEFANILKITGLQIGVKASFDDLRFGKIIFTSDMDLDGWAIRGLLMAMFNRFWPELYDMGVIHVFDTPIAKIKLGKQTLVFKDMNEFETWRKDNSDKSFVTKYYKGLGTSSLQEWKEYLDPKNFGDNLIKIVKRDEVDDIIFKLLFSKERGMTDKRKEWLNIDEEVA